MNSSNRLGRCQGKECWAHIEAPKFDIVTFKSGKPVCPSGREPTQGTTRVQNPDGTWKTVAVGAWRCGTPTFIGH